MKRAPARITVSILLTLGGITEPGVARAAAPAPSLSAASTPAAQPQPAKAAVAPEPALGPKAEVPHPTPPAAEGAARQGDDEAVPGDDPSTEQEIVEESRELEESRAAEEAAIDQEARAASELLRAAGRLGAGNPLRERLNDVLERVLGGEEPTPREEPVAGETPVAKPLAEGEPFDIQRARNAYDIPVEMQPVVAAYIHYFQTSGRKHFVKWMGRSTRYIPMMQEILHVYGMPADTVYLAMIESGFSTYAYSWAKASGPWQFMVNTAKRFGLHTDFWVDERRDPVKSTHAAARYLKELYHQFGDWYLAWAGYNAGGGKVSRAIARQNSTDFWDLANGKVLRKETKHYVPRLIAAALIAKHPRQFGFSEDEVGYLKPQPFEVVKIPDATDLEVISQAAGVPFEDIKELNPELRRWCTPPATAQDPYLLKVPVGAAARFEESFPKIAPKDRLTFRHYVVRSGDTLSTIAKKYGTAPEAIMRINGVQSARKLRLGSDLMIPVPSGRKGEPREAQVRTLAVQSRRRGFSAPALEQEVPAGAPPPPTLLGRSREEIVDGKRRVVYAVQAGDTLWALSQKYGVTVDDLRRWNALPRRRSTLKAGQEIVIFPAPQPPAAASQPETPEPEAPHRAGRRMAVK